MIRFEVEYPDYILFKEYNQDILHGAFFFLRSHMRAQISTSGQLGPVLKSLRQTKRLSQAELGNRIGLSQERISKIENHPEKVTIDQILTLLMALDATLVVEPRNFLQDSAGTGSCASRDISIHTKKDSW